MAKTKDEIVNNAIKSWKQKDKSNENWFKSIVAGAWKSGYRNGLEDAWETAQKVFAKLDYDDVCDCFGVECANDNERFFNQFHPQEAIERLREYEQMKAEKIHLGDEVEAWDTNAWVKFIAIGDNGCEMIYGFDLNGGSYEYPKSACRKTGEHYQISHSKFEEKEGKTNGTTDNHY